MKIRKWLWTCSWRRRFCSTNSWSMETGKWLQSIPSNVRNVMDKLLDLESPCNYDFSVQVFSEKLQIGSMFSEQPSCVWALGYVVPLYLSEIRSKNQAQSPCINVFNLWFFHIFFQYFFHGNLPNMDDFALLIDARNLLHVWKIFAA